MDGIGVKADGYARGVAPDRLVTEGSGGGDFVKVLRAGAVRAAGAELTLIVPGVLPVSHCSR
jgi:hypothetical protein